MMDETEIYIHTQLLQLQSSEHCGVLLLVRGCCRHNRRRVSWRQHRLVRGLRRHRWHICGHHRLRYINKLADCWWPHALPNRSVLGL